MRKLRGLFIVVLTAPLAAAFPVYQAPEEGVELRLDNFTDETLLLATYYERTDNCSGPQAIGELSRNLVTTVTPGQPVTISLMGLRADIADPDSCAVFFSFRPEAGHSYRAALQLYDGQCRLGFNKVKLATNAASSADRVLRTHRQLLLPSRGSCAKLDAEQRARLGM